MRISNGFKYVMSACIIILLVIGMYFRFADIETQANFSTSKGFKTGDKVTSSGIFALVIVLIGMYALLARITKKK